METKSLFTCNDRFIVSWRFRFGQFTLMKNHRIKSITSNVIQLVTSSEGQVAQLTPKEVYVATVSDGQVMG